MPRLLTAIAVLAVALVGCGDDGTEALTVYSGRSETLVAPLIAQFEEETGIQVAVRYAGSTELAATILEEGGNSPADVFFAQDPASLGAVSGAGLFDRLAAETLELSRPDFSDGEGSWVGISGRARVLVYSTESVTELPMDRDDLLDAAWKGRIGIAPGNGSFLSFVAASILLDGENATRAWLEGLAANDPVRFDGNSAIVAAVDSGEIDVGLVNHYYLLRLLDEKGSSTAANHFFDAGGAAALVMPAGAGMLASSNNKDAATEFIEFLLSSDAQAYYASETFEYPLVPGIAASDALPPLDSLDAPEIDLGELGAALDRATELVSEAGLL
ncbi:MAG: extracellular solute-binding protein [Acidimicrobiia bacterium]|nr:extracellular solute-binding protein [Acidimicrobiia bacterium]